jgi:transposase
LRAGGLTNAEVAAIVGVTSRAVSRWASRLIREGIDTIVHIKYGNNHRNMGLQEEEKLLAEYQEEAEAGKIIEVSEIHKAYEGKLGREVGKSTVYGMLKRHKWRKVTPRPRHPMKASEAEIELTKNKIENGRGASQEYTSKSKTNVSR